MQLEERKRKRRCQYDCKDHIFALQTLKSSSSKYDIKVQFCPKFQRDPLPPEHTFPEFNDDRKYFTSAFVLGVDKRILLKNEQQQLMDHQKQIRDSLQKHNQLVFPRPNSKHSLCSVCKEHYKNYYFHISSEEHRERIGLSSYNAHINDLCTIYIDLWEGCQEKADEEAQRLAAQEEQRRLKMAEAGPSEEYSNSLLDCQRGQDPDKYDENGDPISRSKAQMGRRPSNRSYGNNEDTIPIAGRSYNKRGHPEARSAYEPPMRKHYYNGQFNPVHTARQRKQRNYERERMKLMKGTEFQRYKKDFVAEPNQEDDVFTILRPAQGGQSGAQLYVKKAPIQKSTKKILQDPGKKSDEQLCGQQQAEEVGSSSSSSSSSSSASEVKEEEARGLAKNKQEVEEGELSNSDSQQDKFENNTKKIRVEEKGYQFEKKGQRHQWKMDPRAMHNYGYHYPMHLQPIHPQPSQRPQTPDAYKPEYPYKTNQKNSGAQYYKNAPQGYKGLPPNYYYPYGYPMYDHQYPLPPEKGFEGSEKDKGKNHEKPYDYPMHYPWGYNPYYMPPIPPSQQSQQGQQNPQNSSEQTHLQGKGSSSSQNNPYLGSTSININFPMYMCPPPHPPMQGAPYSMPSSRYPMPPPHLMNPYMGYQYGPYQDRNRGEAEYQAGSTSQHQPGYSRSSSQHTSNQAMHPGYGQMPQSQSTAGGRERENQQNMKNKGHGHPGHYYYPPPPYINYQGYQGNHHKQKSPPNKES